MTRDLPSAAQLDGLLTFLTEAGRLKDTLRTGRTALGRHESTAEHSYHLALMIATFDAFLPAHADRKRMIELALIHDLGEAYCGDTPAIDQKPGDGRDVREAEGFARLVSCLDDQTREKFSALFDEYNAAQTLESSLVKGFDKIETMLQHIEGLNEPDFDYEFNLAYGRDRTDAHPLLKAVRAMIDKATRDQMTKQAQLVR